MERTSEDQAATPLELFFDLVFVFALTQVTALMAHDISWHGVANGMLILGVLWWAWSCYAWLCNVVKADEGFARLCMLAGMAVMFVAALTIPEAFHDQEGGLDGPLVIAGCYLVFRVIHLVMFWLLSRDDDGLRAQVLRFAPTVLVSSALLVAAAASHGWTQTGFWAAALVADYIGNYLGGARGWRLFSASHFAERHGLIVIVALGESIVAIGIGADDFPFAFPVVCAALLGLAISSGLWWIYFDISALHGEHALAGAAPDERAAMARDAYSYFHLPLLAGVVLLALGFKKALLYVGDTDHHSLNDPLKGVALAALFGGVALYVLGHVAFKWRTVHQVSRQRIVLVVALLGAWATTREAPVLLQLGVLAVLVWGLVGYETTHYREERRAIRGGHEVG